MSKYPKAFGVYLIDTEEPTLSRWAEIFNCGGSADGYMEENETANESLDKVELVPLPEVERLIRETCEAWRERDSAMSVEIENELIDAIRKGGES